MGWLKNPEDYYSTMSHRIKMETMKELEKEKSRTFVEVEMYFIHMYFQNHATSQDKELYKKLVKR